NPAPTSDEPRGFTGHEHLDDLGLIHMNGRVYDPDLGRFLSADSIVQFPNNSQSYNRYSYVLNNPLSYTDPSGHFAVGLFINFISSIMTQSLTQNIAANVITAAMTKTEALVIQTAIHAGLNGLAQGAASSAMGGTFADGFEAGVLSGVQLGIYNGIGGATSITVEGVLAHGLVGGAFAKARGDSFGSGFASSVFSKLSAGALSNNFSDPFAGAAASAIIGGTASTLSGGKFANGALSSAFAHLFGGAGTRQQQAGNANGGGFLKGTLDVVGKIWALPNTIAGLVHGGAGHISGWIKGTRV
ncbi:RHS repeat-associated core domain-containing protein, partial [Thiolapillus sp.]